MQFLPIALLLGLSLGGPSLAAQDPPAPPAPAPVQAPARPDVGAIAPTFRLNDDTGAATAVGGAAEHWTVLAFYPKASTAG
ncbi:MAG: hypothetical protein KDE27_10980 [Planctomycetes bacterium]|nr:hypothetical protein [Planctomycetota bacterium]